MDMDRERVINGIQECDLNGGLIGNCPYKGILALLKEQEARVMTTDEVRTWVMINRVDRAPIVVEVRGRFITWIIGDDYELPKCDLSSEYYGKTWRCWTSRPTDEQKKTVKWE